jgi:phosphoribosylanthranilate isomerase
VGVVGVFVDWPAEVVAALARALHLDAVQLHGGETPKQVRVLAKQFSVIKAFGVGRDFAWRIWRVTARRRHFCSTAFARVCTAARGRRRIGAWRGARIATGA